MAKKIEALMQEIDKTNQDLYREKQKLNRLKQQMAKTETALKKQERRARVHRFCVIGGAIESDRILGRSLDDNDVSPIVSFLADQENRGHFISQWIQMHTIINP